LTHLAFLRVNFTRQLWPLPVVYPALTCMVTFALWLTFFS